MPLSRTRRRDAVISLSPSTVTVRRTSPPSVTNYGTKTHYRLADSWSVISDDDSGSRSSSKRNVRPVEHAKGNGSHKPVETLTFRVSSTDIRTWEFNPPCFPPVMYTALQPPSPFSENDATWCDKQMRSLLEAVPTGMSLPNFFLELGDVSELPKQILKVSKSFGRNLTDGNMSSVRDLKNFSRRLAKDSANAYLIKVFGIDTLISDFKKILGAQRTVVKRLAWLRKNNQKWVTVRRSQEQSAPPYGVDTSWPIPGASGAWRIKGAANSAKFRRVVGAQVNFDYVDLNAPLAEIKALNAYFGFNRPLSVMWEAIPFSWVVDYFISFQDIVERYKTHDAFSGTPTVRSTWFSTKVEVSGCKFSLYPSGNDARWTGPGSFWEGGFSSYSRKTGVDVPSAQIPSLQFDGALTGSQISNLLAVLTQKGL